jgi:uncharacterized membrane protein SpoIIM required for sporulation
MDLQPRPPLTLRSAAFRKSREANWQELERILARLEKHSLRKVAAEDLQKLPILYRGVVSSLSVARSIALDRALLLYLEDLSLRAYLAVYGPRTSALEAFGTFLRRGFPSAVRRARWHLLIAALAMLLGTLIGYGLAHSDEDWLSALVPAGLSGDRGIASTADDLRRHEIFAPWRGFTESFVVFANSLFRHNSIIALMSFGLGLLAGVPSLLLISYQGLVLGAFIELHARRGLFLDFMGWLLIHGVTEIGAILVAGAGGLVLAEKILFPGAYGRLDSLARSGPWAAELGGGAVLMLFAAGLIEGGFRQLIDSTPGRFAFAAVTACLWLVYFLSGRKDVADVP